MSHHPTSQLKVNHVPVNGIMIALNHSIRGAIDLASIMVGIIVIGIIGGVIAATVFAIVPWAQDEAAKQTVDSVEQAENAYRGFEVEKAAPGSYGDKDQLNNWQNDYGTENGLLPTGDYQVRTGVDTKQKPCYATVARSRTKNLYYGSNLIPTALKTSNGIASVNAAIVAAGCVLTGPFINFTGDGSTVLPAPTTGLPINTAAESGSYYNGGNYLGRNLRLSFNGAWDMNQIPYIVEPASVAKYAGKRYPYAEGIKNVKAWIGGVETNISMDLNDSYIAWDPNGEYYFELSTKKLIIGNNMNATIREFLNTGSLSFQIEGSSSVNNLIMDTALQVGTTSNPPSGDGTYGAGDTLVQAPVMADASSTYHYLYTSSSNIFAQGSPQPQFSFTDGAPNGMSIFTENGYGGVTGFNTSKVPLSFRVTATNSAGSSTSQVNLRPYGSTSIAGNIFSQVGTGEGADGPRGVSILRQNSKIVVAPDGTVYVLDIGGLAYYSALKKIDPITNVLSTISTDVPSNSRAIALNGNTVYISTATSVYKMSTSGSPLELVAGGDLITTQPEGYVDANGSDARFQSISDMEYSSSDGLLYVADGPSIRSITDENGLAARVTTFVGSGDAANSDFVGLLGITIAPNGDIYVADQNANKIFRVTPQKAVYWIAGYGDANSQDGPGRISSSFSNPADIAYTLKDGVPSLLVTDSGTNRLRKITDLDGARNVSTINPYAQMGYSYPDTDYLAYLFMSGPTTIVTGPNNAVYMNDARTVRIIFGVN